LILEYECYKANYAQRIHDASICKRGRKPKKVSDSLLVHIRDKLRKKYSPDAIVGEIKRDELFNEIVCTKTLYNLLRNGYISGFKMNRGNRVVRKRKKGGEIGKLPAAYVKRI